MFESAVAALSLYIGPKWIAQAPVIVEPTVDTPEEAALVFSGPQLFAAVLAGLVLAFAFQLLLTNLGVGAALSLAGGNSDSHSHDHHDRDRNSLGDTINKIGFWVGLGTLISVSIALFVACYLAVKLSLISNPGIGAIVGLVIWGAYFSLLVWASSTTVGSLVGSVVNTATSGFQALFGTATAALGAQFAKNQVVSTAEAAASAVRREITHAIDPLALREQVEDYMQALRPPELDLNRIRSEFDRILGDANFSDVASGEALRKIDRQALAEVVSSRTDLSKRDVNRIVDQLEAALNQTVKRLPQQDTMSQMLDYLKSVAPDQLVSDQFTQKLDDLVNELRQRREAKAMTPMDQAKQMGFNALMGIVMGRTDLSDLNVEKIVGQLKQARDSVSDQANQITAQVSGKTPPYSTIRIDVENYLLNAHPWQLKSAVVEQEFREVLFDPEANPGAVRHELQQIKRQDFIDLLTQKGLFTQAEIQSLADRLEGIRLQVLAAVAMAEELEKATALRQQVETYLRYTPRAQLLNSNENRQAFKAILEDPDSDTEQLQNRLAAYDRATLATLLAGREDLNLDEKDALANELVEVRDRVIFDSRNVDEQVKMQVATAQKKVASYLRYTGKEELNPEGIQRDLQTLLEDPALGLKQIRGRLSQFDRDTLVQLLAQRQDLSEAEANRILDQSESVWHSVVHSPQTLTAKAQEQYDRTTQAIADYLRSTGKQELNPEGIKRDLTKLLNDPQRGALAIRDRLTMMDRDTLVKLLSQRQDLSEDDVNNVIDQVQQTIRSVVKSPRRLATRTQTQLRDFRATVENYLANTGKEELNPEAIKRDLQLLLHDPRVGAESIGDRLKQFDRSTMIALLSQRQDISQAEAERIVDQILAVRDQFVDRIRSIQRQIQDVIDGIFARIRYYLNSLDRPELNYDGIKRDVRTLFDDPQAGFDALRDRLGQFNRDTLVAIMSSREDISQEDANRVIDQVERARNSVLQRAERLQQETQRRIEEAKMQAQRQVEETRKAAATAAWWLFGTASLSALLSAIAGFIGVIPD